MGEIEDFCAKIKISVIKCPCINWWCIWGQIWNPSLCIIFMSCSCPMDYYLEQQVHGQVDISSTNDEETVISILKYIIVGCWICTIRLCLHWKKVVLEVLATVVTRSMVKINPCHYRTSSCHVWVCIQNYSHPWPTREAVTIPQSSSRSEQTVVTP